MPVYSYKGYDQSGKSEAGTIDASNENLAFEMLLSQGITVIDLASGNTLPTSDVAWYKRDIQLWGAELPYQEQAIIADLLATLFQAGLSVSEVIRIAILSTEKADVKRHFERVGQRVDDGESFPDAFESENRLFSPIFVSFLRISDTSNALPTLLNELSRFFQNQSTIRQKITSALIYPAILISAAIALFFVIVLYLAPNLEPIFASVGREAHGTLGFLLWVNSVFREYWLAILLGFLASLFCIIALRQITWVKSTAVQLRFSLPIFGDLSYLSTLSRLVQSTQLLLVSGLPLAEALKVSAQNMGQGSTLSARFAEASDALEAGQSAATVFDDDLRIPPVFKELFRIGEHTNTLPSTLEALSDYVSAKLEQKSQKLLSLITPVLTLVLGVGIGILIYSLMGAILEVNEIVL